MKWGINLKNTWLKIKWLIEKIKPFILYLFIIIILGTFVSLIGIYRAVITKEIIDAATSANTSLMIKFLIIFGICIILDISMRAFNSVLSTKCSVDVFNNIQKRLYTKIVRIKWDEMSTYHSGDLLTRMTSDVETISSLFVSTIPSIISLSVLLIGSFITLFTMEPRLAITIIIISPIMIIISYFFSSKLKKLYLKAQQLESKYRSFISESLQNIVVIKTFCLESINVNTGNNFQKERKNLAVSKSKLSVISNYSISISFSVGVFFVFLFGSFNISKGIMTFGTLTAMLQLIGNIQGPFSGLASTLPQIVASIASTERIMELEALNMDDIDDTIENMESVGVVFDNVGFSYKEDVKVLDKVSLKINEGETVALIGPSGEGKTTFINLLLVLLTPKEGNINLTCDTKMIPVNAATRKLMSYVPQGNTLFSGTIADNLRMGCKNATDDELEAALKQACAWSFVEKCEDGLYTIVGERGKGFSEGQAQRISIARALLHKTPILILDEATSALDSKTETEVLKNIKNLKPSPTCIIITHRTTALEICNKIFKIEDFKVQ